MPTNCAPCPGNMKEILLENPSKSVSDALAAVEASAAALTTVRDTARRADGATKALTDDEASKQSIADVVVVVNLIIFFFCSSFQKVELLFSLSVRSVFHGMFYETAHNNRRRRETTTDEWWCWRTQRQMDDDGLLVDPKRR
mmetsp:Transcript_7195/g.10543  ORF Transcript_7195/g.10543 Transcript_7195/m.10543 type:complete len:142 (-) Transcript_7195:115-540(-)